MQMFSSMYYHILPEISIANFHSPIHSMHTVRIQTRTNVLIHTYYLYPPDWSLEATIPRNVDSNRMKAVAKDGAECLVPQARSS